MQIAFGRAIALSSYFEHGSLLEGKFVVGRCIEIIPTVGLHDLLVGAQNIHKVEEISRKTTHMETITGGNNSIQLGHSFLLLKILL